MYKLEFSTKFKKDAKRYEHSKNRETIRVIIEQLINIGNVAKKHKPHILKGNYKDCMECHILPDLLLIWQKEKNTIKLIRLGSHSELFK